MLVQRSCHKDGPGALFHGVLVLNDAVARDMNGDGVFFCECMARFGGHMSRGAEAASPLPTALLPNVAPASQRSVWRTAAVRFIVYTMCSTAIPREVKAVGGYRRHHCPVQRACHRCGLARCCCRRSRCARGCGHVVREGAPHTVNTLTHAVWTRFVSQSCVARTNCGSRRRRVSSGIE